MKMIKIKLVGLSGFLKFSSKPFWTDDVDGREFRVRYIIPQITEVLPLKEITAEDTILYKEIMLVFLYTGETEEGHIHIFRLNDVKGSL